MPVQLATIAISPGITSGTVSLAAMQVSALPRSNTGPFAHLELINETAAGLVFTFPTATNQQWAVPAGKHRIIPIPPGESQTNWTLLNNYPTAFTQQCFVFYFDFNETPVDLGQVGAAQIGNQPRVIALGPTPLDDHGVAVGLASGADQVTNKTIFIPGGGANTISVFVYWIYLKTEFSGGTAANSYTIFADTRTSGLVIKQTINLAQPILSVNATSGDSWSLLIPAAPKLFFLINPPPDGSDRVTVRIHNNGVNALDVFWDIGWSISNELYTPSLNPGTHGYFTANAGPF